MPDYAPPFLKNDLRYCPNCDHILTDLGTNTQWAPKRLWRCISGVNPKTQEPRDLSGYEWVGDETRRHPMAEAQHEELPRKSAALSVKKLDKYVFCWAMMDVSTLQDQNMKRCKLLGCQGLDSHTEIFTVKPPHPVPRYDGA